MMARKKQGENLKKPGDLERVDETGRVDKSVRRVVKCPALNNVVFWRGFGPFCIPLIPGT